ncbi:oligosaccharide flippase family protein [Sphingomonas kaistensis]|uniref:Oligosaccharide flippase family protein n=1 Tax=Sphingomonas kaistensis TaxID=298708 RepID=A0ABZ2G4S4_9SPHN
MSAGAAPTSEQSSYRRILTSTSIVGGATVGTILIGIVRVKLLALMVGPAGIGLMGILANVSGLVSAVLGLGLSAAAVREIAAAPSPRQQATVRHALWLATIPLAFLGAAGLWFFRDAATRLAADDPSLAFLVGLSGLAVAFSILGAAQQGVLQGLQRIKALSMVKVGGALLATLIALPAVYSLGQTGILIAVVAVPLATWLVAIAVAPRELPRAPATSRTGIGREWKALLRLGVPLTITSVAQLLSLAAVRAVVARDGGTEAAGLFQAVIAITSMNITLVLGAMAADYFPRISAAAMDSAERSRIVNQQLHSALLLAAPLIVGMIGAAPLVLSLLYSQAFQGAEWMLRWQLLGDLLKIAGWALGFVLLTSDNRRAFMAVEFLYTAVLVASSFLLVPTFGLTGAGMAYALSYLVYAGVLLIVCARGFSVSIDAGNRKLLLALVGAGAALMVLASWNFWVAALAAILAAGVLALVAVRSLSARAGIRIRLPGR